MTDGKHILIAEDTEFLLEMMRTAFEENGVEVTAAANGQAAIDAMDTRQPDLLILDLLMPKIDGYGVMQHIQDRGYQFPVVILTNMGDQANQQKCLQMGAKEFWIKSDMDEESLWAQVEKYLV